MTRRREIRAALERGPMTIREVAGRWGIKFKQASEDVEHVAKSAKPLRIRLDDPARCLDCGFEFKDRRRLTAPSRCPRCKSTDTTEPVFRLR